ncbi:MAG: M56 family metallopeptidase, partial [Acidobacteriota bacterium]
MSMLAWTPFDASLLQSDAVRVVAWTLLHFLWQGALVGGVLAAALTLLHRQDARLRYAISLGALLTMAVLPITTAMTLVSQTELASPATPSSSPPMQATASASAPLPAPADAALPAASNLSTGETLATRWLEPALPWLVLLWLAGVAALAVMQYGGWQRVSRLRTRGVRSVEDELQQLCDSLGQRLGIQRSVPLLESARVAVPTVVGLLRPVILVPVSALSGLTPQQLTSILAHELAHVRRYDPWVNALQVAIETVLFYHPAVWWASRQVRTLREHCCDDLAVELCGDRMTLARALAELEEMRFATPVFALGATGGPLLQRIRRLVGDGEELRSPSWLPGSMASAALVAIGLVLAFSSEPGIAQVADEEARPDRAEREGSATHTASVSGRWLSEIPQGESERDSVWIQMRSRDSNGRSSTSMTFSRSELIGWSAVGDVRFELRRPAGTITFAGDVDDRGIGSGTFEFRPNREFLREMDRLGYGELSPRKSFECALFEVDPGMVQELSALGYDDVALSRLIELAIHGARPDFIRAIASAGYPGLPLKRLVEMRIHGITPEFIERLVALGYDELPAQRLVEMRIHGVSPNFIEQLQALGYDDLSATRLVEMRIHGVDPDSVRG